MVEVLLQVSVQGGGLGEQALQERAEVRGFVDRVVKTRSHLLYAFIELARSKQSSLEDMHQRLQSVYLHDLYNHVCFCLVDSKQASKLLCLGAFRTPLVERQVKERHYQDKKFTVFFLAVDVLCLDSSWHAWNPRELSLSWRDLVFKQVNALFEIEPAPR